MALWQSEDYGQMADKGCWTLFGVTAVIVFLRIICRMYLTRGAGRLGYIGLDDHITVFCVLVLLVTCILVSIGSSHGLGRHMTALQPEQIVLSLKWNVIISAVLIWSFSLPKFAIIAILKRILSFGTKTTVVFLTLALTSQACILATSIWWFKQCSPVAYGWNRNLEGGGTCAPVSVMADLGYFTSAYSAFLDIFFALYPIPFIMRLNMDLRYRISVSIALGLSVLACIVSIYKLAIFGQVFAILAVDPTYPVPYLDLLGVAEGSILIICSSLPTLGPLYRMARGKLTSTGDSNNPTNAPPSNNIKSHPKSNNNDGWANYQGHRLEDPEAGSTGTGMHSSVDDIPLVPAAKPHH